jgi:hypothetical protein
MENRVNKKHIFHNDEYQLYKYRIWKITNQDEREKTAERTGHIYIRTEKNKLY